MSVLLTLFLGFLVNEIVTVGGQPLPLFFDFTTPLVTLSRFWGSCSPQLSPSKCCLPSGYNLTSFP